MKLKGRYLLLRMIWAQVLCFALLLVFISIDDEILIPRFLPPDFPYSPSTVAGVLDSAWVVVLMVMSLIIQLKYIDKLRVLEGLLSVCANCKKIHDGKDHWSPIEEYIRTRSHADFSHDICPDCGVKLYGDLYLQAMAKGGEGDGRSGGGPAVRKND
jgi:hypothetical protein